ncbi:MAG: DUF1513 domain-containing protein [Rhodospirillales bacterium]|nr:DUF1513 domain-containing protein [Rhodospirillales bacterium]
MNQVAAAATTASGTPGRRRIIAGALGTAVAAAVHSTSARAAPTGRKAVYLVPGYRAEAARFRGMPADRAPALRRSFPAAYDGGVTLVARIDERDGTIRRALMPIVGHKIAVAPGGAMAVWSSMNGSGYVTFDPATLEFGRAFACDGAGFVGGGHAVYSNDGSVLIATERKRAIGRPDSVAALHGRLVVRDAVSFKVLASHDVQGMSPHDIALTEDGRYAVVANYGSPPRLPGDASVAQFEPCITVIELASGRMIDKRASPVGDGELRHLAMAGPQRAAVICARQTTGVAARAADDRDSIEEADFSVDEETYYRPAPVVWYDLARRDRPAIAALPDDPSLARQGQSIVYDARHDEVLVAFASAHTVIVFAGLDGAVKRVIRTDRLGLRYPRGVELHPDGQHYVVSGSWQGLYQFRRGTHELDTERCLHPVLFDHSHLTLLPA